MRSDRGSRDLRPADLGVVPHFAVELVGHRERDVGHGRGDSVLELVLYCGRIAAMVPGPERGVRDRARSRSPPRVALRPAVIGHPRRAPGIPSLLESGPWAGPSATAAMDRGDPRPEGLDAQDCLSGQRDNAPRQFRFHSARQHFSSLIPLAFAVPSTGSGRVKAAARAGRGMGTSRAFALRSEKSRCENPKARALLWVPDLSDGGGVPHSWQRGDGMIGRAVIGWGSAS